MYKHVIFDIFGTLVHPIPNDPYVSVLKSLKEHNGALQLEHLHPLIYPGSFASWCSALQLPNQHLNFPTKEDLVLYDDVLEAFDFLAQQHIPFSVMSNIGRLYADLIDQTSWIKRAKYRFMSCSVGLSKPNPMFFKYACSVINESPEQILFLGDSPKNDVLGPRQIGMQSDIVRNTTSLVKQLKVIYDTY